MRIAALFVILLHFSGAAWAQQSDSEQIRALGPDAARALKAGDAAALAAIGRNVERGENGRKKNDKAAVALFQTACEMGGADGCNGLGFMYHQGRGVPKSYERAAALFKQSCEGGAARGCGSYGFVLEWGQGVPVDYKAAESLYRRSCEGGFATGCVNLGTVFEYGKGFPRDADAAAWAYRQALTLEPENKPAHRGLKRLKKSP